MCVWECVHLQTHCNLLFLYSNYIQVFQKLQLQAFLLDTAEIHFLKENFSNIENIMSVHTQVSDENINTTFSVNTLHPVPSYHITTSSTLWLQKNPPACCFRSHTSHYVTVKAKCP